MKKLLSVALSAMLSAVMLTTVVSAESLDDIGTALPSTTTSQAGAVDSNSAAQGIQDAISGVGLTDEDMQAAAETVRPIVKYVNYGLGIIVALLGTVLLAVTVIDLVYIISPKFIRDIGSNKAAQAQGGMGGMGGMGMMGMGGMGGGSAAPAETGFASLISDDCRAALAECGTEAAPAGGMGGMGGMGMMGMGGMGGAPATAPKSKTVALCYLKKRVFTLVIIGVCIVVLTCTLFLDVGMTIGTWIVDLVSGAI